MSARLAACGIGAISPGLAWAVHRAVQEEERAAREAVAGAALRGSLRADGIDVEALEAEAARTAAEPGMPWSRESWFRALAVVRGHPQRDGLIRAIREGALSPPGGAPDDIASALVHVLAAYEKPRCDVPVYPETITRMREAARKRGVARAGGDISRFPDRTSTELPLEIRNRKQRRPKAARERQ